MTKVWVLYVKAFEADGYYEDGVKDVFLTIPSASFFHENEDLGLTYEQAEELALYQSTDTEYAEYYLLSKNLHE